MLACNTPSCAKVLSQIFVQEGVLNFWRENNSRGYPVKIFVKKVARGNAVQIFSNFPAKSLSIYRANFLMTPL